MCCWHSVRAGAATRGRSRTPTRQRSRHLRRQHQLHRQRQQHPAACISTSGIKVTDSTITGSILDSGTLTGGISIDSASKIASASIAIQVTGPTFAGGISNAGKLAGTKTGIQLHGTTTFAGGLINA